MAAEESEEVDETTRGIYGDIIDISIGCLEQYAQDKTKFKAGYHDQMGKAKLYNHLLQIDINDGHTNKRNTELRSEQKSSQQNDISKRKSKMTTLSKVLIASDLNLFRIQK